MKATKLKADAMFLRAFDACIDRVYHRLASSGVAEDEIWAAFRQAMAAITEVSDEVELEPAIQTPRRHIKPSHRKRSSIGTAKRLVESSMHQN